MKKIIIPALTCLFLVGLSACNKCQDCTCGSTTEEVCRDDFDSNDEYKEGIVLLEAFGCDCN